MDKNVKDFLDKFAWMSICFYDIPVEQSLANKVHGFQVLIDELPTGWTKASYDNDDGCTIFRNGAWVYFNGVREAELVDSDFYPIANMLPQTVLGKFIGLLMAEVVPTKMILVVKGDKVGLLGLGIH